MGRKIPGKKHKGVKDPLKQRAKRLAEVKDKVNAPPVNIDDQEIPKSLERVIKLKELVKSGKIQKKKKSKKKDNLISVGMEQQNQKKLKGRPEKVVPILKQKPWESAEMFLRRVDTETRAFINETVFETKYNVKVQRNPKSGNIEGIEKLPKDEIDELMRLQAKHKNVGKKKKKVVKNGVEVQLSKSQKRKQKLLLKKEKKMNENLEEEIIFKRDKVEFGEVAHAPPELKVKPRKVGGGSIKKENIKAINRSGKRKDLPIGERSQLEKEQSKVIELYRKLKKNNQ